MELFVETHDINPSSYAELEFPSLRPLGRVDGYTDILHECLFQAVRRMKSSPLTADEIACIEEVDISHLLIFH